MTHRPSRDFTDPDELVEQIIARVGPDIRLALPLGLGKANHIVNALYQRVAADSSLSLQIFTALTLEIPRPSAELERRFLEPLVERLFSGYPELLYSRGLREGSLPSNIRVHEFFLLPGRWLNQPAAQQNFQLVNYTQVLPALLRSRINLLAQLLATTEGDEGSEQISLSCNPDLSVDLLEARERGELDFLAVGQINRQLPDMTGAARRPRNDFELILDDPAFEFPLFGLPQDPVNLSDYAIGLQTTGLIADGGTLQIGIGSIGDAICQALRLRQQDNRRFNELLDGLHGNSQTLQCRAPFQQGLYVASEMLVEGFLPLMEMGIVKREVAGCVIHAGFFLASQRFYRALKQLPLKQREKIGMAPISFTNQLYGDELNRRRDRPSARFVNSALMATLLGGVVSDGLENGQIISGVGGQYNFVAMAFALPGARSIITLPATRTHRGRITSNIRWSYGHLTIPRHLRDLVVTEYGVADLRGKCDAEVVAEMLKVSDSRFQPELLGQAKKAGKIPLDYQIPAPQRQNLPERIREVLEPAAQVGDLPAFPFGSDYTPEEEQLLPALKTLSEQAGNNAALVRTAWRGVRSQRSDQGSEDALRRMGLARPHGWREQFYRALLLGAMQTRNRNRPGHNEDRIR